MHNFQKFSKLFQDLDTELEPFGRPQSALGHRDEDEENIKDKMGMDTFFGEQSNLFKGKSMPSLR